MIQAVFKPFQDMTPGEMAERNGVDLWRACKIVETLLAQLGRFPTGPEVAHAAEAMPDDVHPGYVHLVTAWRTVQGAT